MKNKSVSLTPSPRSSRSVFESIGRAPPGFHLFSNPAKVRYVPVWYRYDACLDDGIMVFACGPKSLMEGVTEACRTHSASNMCGGGVKFDFTRRRLSFEWI